MRPIIACCAAFALLAGCGAPRSNVPAPKPLVIAVIADNRGGGAAHRMILQSIKRDGAEAILNLGDMIHPSKGHEWPDFMRDMNAVYGDETRKVLDRYFVTAGGWEEQVFNRDKKKADPSIARKDWKFPSKHGWPGYEPDNEAGQAFYERYFRYRQRVGRAGSPIVTYSRSGDYHAALRGLHVISLYISDEWHQRRRYHIHDDPKARAAAWEEQIVWLDDRLTIIRLAEPNAPLIVMAHDSGWVGVRSKSFRGRLAKLLAKHQVDIALCGDGHTYRHYKDPWTLKFMVPAALSRQLGGYFRITIDGARIKLEHCDPKGAVRKTFTKRAGEPLGSRPTVAQPGSRR